MLIGLLAGAFFSTTFVLNRVMSLEGGHWYWSGALRYGYMILLLGSGIALFQGFSFLRTVFRELLLHPLFWTLSGSIGFGAFYALICFSADHSPGWVIATTWQLTIIASLFVLMGFGRRFPGKIWAWALVVFGGVSLVNLGEFEAESIGSLALGIIPVLLAAFCYPLGNQLVWEARAEAPVGIKTGIKSGTMARTKALFPRVPKLDSPVLDNAFVRVFLLSAGSLPFWIILYLFTDPGIPSPGQWVNTALVAVFSGVVATTLFLYARGRADTPAKLAALDATQSSEVIFALAGEILFLGAGFPNLLGIAGIFIAGLGLIAFAVSSK